VDNAVRLKLPVDCAGIDPRLPLRVDGVFRLRRIYPGKPDGAYSEVGRWTADADGQVLTLRSSSQTLMFAVKDDATLRMLDQREQPLHRLAILTFA
jgi:uncharacterized lipoprotein NlpE involved in copper resistance